MTEKITIRSDRDTDYKFMYKGEEVVLGADMKNYVDFEIKPNLPVLGKEYGRLIPQIKQKIAEFNQMELATKVEAGGIEYIEIGEVQIPLSKDNLLVTMQGKDGFAFSGTGEIGVVIETEITPELREEGYLREILSKVQNMRKDSGFEVMDNINLYVGGNETLEAVVKKYEDIIKHDTLAKDVLYNVEGKDYVQTPINGENLNIFVEVVK